MSVYTGDCSKLISETGGSETETWQAIRDKVYYLYVYQRYGTGPFELLVEEIIPVANDLCPNALMLAVDSSVTGSTQNATRDIIAGEACPNEFYQDNTLGIWYQITGSGNFLRATSCSNSTETLMNAFTGVCSRLVCLAESRHTDICDTGLGRTVTWQATDGQEYYLYAYSLYGIASFEIRVEEFIPASNDECTTAAMLAVNSSVIGNTESSHRDEIVGEPCLEESLQSRVGVWYQITGNDNFMSVTSCPNGFDSVISVYKGDCSNLICLAESRYDEKCSTLDGRVAGRTVSWQAVHNEVYYLYVYERHGSGTFEMLVEEFVPVPNDLCTNALTLAANDVVTGRTQHATAHEIAGETCPEQSFQPTFGIWYRISGNGNSIRATACSERFGQTRISVYTGDCSKLVCLAEGREIGSCETGGGQTASWQATRGQDYFLYVFQLHYVGSFEILVEEITPVPNDLCTNSLMLAVNSSVIGSIQNATLDDIDEAVCRYYQYSAGVWYQVAGNGGSFRATASSGDDGETRMIVYSGDCSKLVCESESQWDISSTISIQTMSWQATRGQNYYLYVFQLFGSGSFEIMVEESFPVSLGDHTHGSVFWYSLSCVSLLLTVSGLTFSL